MIKTIAIAIAVLVAAVLAFAATRPREFAVTRTIDIQAPPERIFGLIADFHQWGAWSPWEKIDPGMKRTFSGAAIGAGAVYEWSGNSKVGAGRMEILEANAPSNVRIKLDFLKPIEGHNLTEFTVQPNNAQTRVVWLMQGPMAYIAKLMSVFVSMDKMIGADFERGLRNLKAAAESPAP